MPSTHDSFDPRSFRKYMKTFGRPYRKRAVELISISRTFAQAQDQEQGFGTHDDLSSVLQVVDDALRSATKAQKKPLKDVDENFKKAIDVLSAYEKRHHPKTNTHIAKRMRSAEETDTSSWKALKELEEDPARRSPVEGPTKIVKFILCKSLPDKSPVIVKQVLCERSDINEILWNFSRRPTGKDPDGEKKRLTLRQHPHFYRKLPEKYWGGFEESPTETFYRDQINVLTDNSSQAGRVYLDIPSKRKRVFSNVWDARDAIIFKDITGKLEGESIVGSVIQHTPNLWCFEEPPRSRSHTSQQSFSTTSATTLSSSPSTKSPKSTTSSKGELVNDWKEPIRRMTRSSLDMNIRISSMPADFSPNYPPAQDPTLPSPTSSFDSNPIVDNSPIDIPETPTRSSTPLSYKTVRSKHLSQQSLVAELSSRPTPPPPETPPVSQAPRTTASPPPPPPPLSSPMPPSPSPSPQEGRSTDPDSEDEGLSDDASTVTSPFRRKPKKRKWYQRVVDRVFRRGSSQ